MIKQSSLLSLALVPALASCASMHSGDRTQRSGSGAVIAPAPSGMPSGAVVATMDEVASNEAAVDAAMGGSEVAAGIFAAPESAPRQDAVQDRYTPPSFWSDPAHQKRFAAVFFSETEVEPQVNEDERETMVEISTLMREEDFDAAITRLQAVRGPQSTALYDLTLGNLLYQKDDLEGAVEAYRTAVDKHPKFRRAQQMLGESYFRTEDYAGAAAVYASLNANGGGDGTSWLLLAVSHLRSERYIAAESAFRMSLAMSPDRSEAKMGLAESFFRQGRFADAVALFDELLEDEPDNVQLWQFQGEAYVMLRKPREAAKNFEIVDRLSGGAPASTLNDLGNLYAQLGLFDLATPAFLRALQADETLSVDRAITAALHFQRAGSYDETLALLTGIETQAAARLDDEARKKMLKLRAFVAVARGDGEEEARVLERLVEIDPLDGEALILLGQRASRNGELPEAVSYFERAASIEGFATDAALRHGEALVLAGEYVKAVPYLRQASAGQPEREDIRKFLDQVERAAKQR